MSLAMIGALIGLAAGIGIVVAIAFSPPMRKPTLADRVAPYVRDRADAASPSWHTASIQPGLVRRLISPILRDAVRFLDRVVGGQASVRRRLRAIGSDVPLEQFRADQVVWGAVGMLAGFAVVSVALLSGHLNPLVLVTIVVLGAVAGVLARDWWLSQVVAKYHARVLAEFPVVVEMLALAVAAGEDPLSAITRVCRLTKGHLTHRLERILADTRAGAPLHQALGDARDSTDLEPLARFLDSMAVAMDRGTPLAEVLHAQASDARALGKRQLLESGGKKEIAMMIPVVFLILPITILFAFFPGFIAITTVAQ